MPIVTEPARSFCLETFCLEISFQYP